MQPIDPSASRIETLLALCIAAHLGCLCRHPDADEAVRDIANNMHDEWQITARNADKGLAGTSATRPD